MTAENSGYIASAYLKLILAADPSVTAVARRIMGEDFKTATQGEFLSGEWLPPFFHALQMRGMSSLLLHHGHQLHLATHGSLGAAALAAPDLKTALSTLTRFTRVRSDLYKVALKQSGSWLEFTLKCNVDDALVDRWLSEIVLDLVRNITQTIMGHDVGNQIRLQFTHARSSYADELSQYMHTACSFDQAENTLALPASWSDVRSPLADERTYRQSVLACEQSLARLNTRISSVERVRNHLHLHFETQFETYLSSPNTAAMEPSAPPSLEKIASAFSISPRTLARHLNKEETGYQSILKEIRGELARKWLRHTPVSIGDLSRLLGYAEAANFTRAFKREVGCSPQNWRKVR